GAGVEAVAQLARMQVRREAVHVREAPEVGLEVPVVGAQAAFPGIVDDDVAVTDVAHAALDQRVSGLAHQLVGHERAEPVPRVPAHRRRRREAVGERAQSHLASARSGGRSVLWVAARIERDEVRLARHLDELRRERGRLAEEARGVDELLDDVARVAGAQADVLRAVDRQDLRHRLGAVLDVLPRAHPLEDLLVLRDRRRLDTDLVSDASEEGLVDEVGGIEVRREDDEHVERDLDLLAGVQRQVVHALLERDDPPVEKILRRDALTSEVVDHEDATVRLHLERRLVELRGLVVDEVERLERELAAGHDDGTLADDPAVVEPQPIRRGLLHDRTVVDLIEDLDDLLVDLDRVWQDDLTAHERYEHFPDRRLAVAGWAEQEDRFAGVHGRPELRERLAGDDHVRGRARGVLRRDVDVRDGLALHRGDVGRERHRRVADVLAAGERLLRLLRAAVDDDELVRRGRDARATADLDEALGLEEIHDLVCHALDGEAQRARDVGHRHLPAQIERLQREVREETERESSLLDRLWLGWQRDRRQFRMHRGGGSGGRQRSSLRLRLVQSAS